MRRRVLAVLLLVPVGFAVERVGAGLLRHSPGPGGANTAVVLPVDRAVKLHTRPSADSPAETVSGRTPFGSRRALPVVDVEGRWLRVLGDGGGSNDLRWLRPPPGTETKLLPTRVVIDLRARRLTVLRGPARVASWTARSGRPGAPTPPGQYAVTDELSGPRYSSAYGCCIVALNGRQRKLPSGWGGGDRLAIHGTPTGAPEATIGCVTLADGAMRRLMGLVRRGTVVTIRRS
jgi:lipoprotein-anchoring transpeptidase ErfK/SrfK